MEENLDEVLAAEFLPMLLHLVEHLGALCGVGGVGIEEDDFAPGRPDRPDDFVDVIGMLDRRSKWTPKMFKPSRASSLATASPKPLDEPTIRAHRTGPWGALIRSLLSG